MPQMEIEIRERMYSNWVRVVFEQYQIPYQRKYLFDMGLGKSKLVEYDSNPARNVRMQWSNTYLLVFTTPPSGFVNGEPRKRTYIFAHPYGHKKMPSKMLGTPIITNY